MIFLASFGGGCVSDTSGSAALTAENVKQIKKNVTTRAEVEAIFGPPANSTLLGDGKRTMQYYYVESNMHSDWQAFVPILQLFGAKASGQTTTRSLQVILDASDVVVDYQYSESTNDLEVGTFGSSSTPVSNPPPINSSPP